MVSNGPASATDPRQRVLDERGFRRAACNPLEALRLTSLDEFDTAILPLGSFEWHGGESLGLDSIIAVWLSERICKAISACVRPVVLPPVYYGASHEWLRFGAVSATREALRAYIASLLHTIAGRFHNVIVVNGHGGNSSILRGILEELTYEQRVDARILLVEWWRIASWRLGHMDEGEACLARAAGVWGGTICECSGLDPHSPSQPRCRCRARSVGEETCSKILRALDEYASSLCRLLRRP